LATIKVAEVAEKVAEVRYFSPFGEVSQQKTPFFPYTAFIALPQNGLAIP
jgi:hypothetical protein